MQIDKQQIVEFLRNQGDQGKAQQADSQLPEQVETDNSQHQNILQSLGINPGDLVKKFLGGRGIPGF